MYKITDNGVVVMDRLYSFDEALEMVIDRWINHHPSTRQENEIILWLDEEELLSTASFTKITFKYGNEYFCIDNKITDEDSFFDDPKCILKMVKDPLFFVYERIRFYDCNNKTTFYDHIRPKMLTDGIGHDGILVQSWTDVEKIAGCIVETSAQLRISKSGSSLIIRVTDICKLIGATDGEIVNVTIKKIN